MTRAAIFAAVRAAKPGVFDDPDNIAALDALLDRFGVARESTGRRAINRAGLDIIKESEGLRLKAYRCPANVLTIGYGSTGPHVREGLVITEAQADELLRSDLRRFEDAVAEAAPDATDNQFAAMVSLAFNVGEAAFLRSTVLREHRAGNHRAAADAFAMWNKAGGRELPGLTKRRAKEAALYRKVTP